MPRRPLAIMISPTEHARQRALESAIHTLIDDFDLQTVGTVCWYLQKRVDSHEVVAMSFLATSQSYEFGDSINRRLQQMASRFRIHVSAIIHPVDGVPVVGSWKPN